MNASLTPCVEIGSFDAGEGAEADLFDQLPQRIAWRGIFACQLRFRPFDELDRFRHGFNLDTLLNEALDRLKLFIETQHFPGQAEEEFIPLNQRRAVALRCCNRAEAGVLTIVVMGRVYGIDPQETRTNAQRACRELCSIFPYDYHISPIESPDAFHQLTGSKLLADLNDPDQMAGIERFEGLVDAGSERVYLSGMWGHSLAGNEQIWRTLAGMEAATIYQVTLQPILVSTEILAALHNMSDLLAQTTQQVKAGNVRQLYELAAQRCAGLLKSGRRAYLGQVRLMSAAPLDEYAPRAIGFALSRQPEAQPAAPGFQIAQPESPAELNCWKNQVAWLTPIARADPAERRFVWPRELMLAEEAAALFRPPYPLRRETPGVRLQFHKEDAHGER